MPRFARRLLTLATFEIAALLGTLTIVVALFFFGAYIQSLSTEIDTTFVQVSDAVYRLPSTNDARAVGTAAAGRFLPADVEAVFIDASRRVAIYRPARGDSNLVIDVRSRGDLGGDPESHNYLARPILGLATAFGLQPRRVHTGNLDVIVKIDEFQFVRTVANYVVPLLLALIVSIALGYFVARTLTNQVLRPLVDVVAALERFARGDLTPQPIPADSRHELGSLAIAYNGAIAQMEGAFAERDNANAAIRRFIADAGHQLRTPLTVVRGFIAVLRKTDERADRDRALTMMHDQTTIMAALIEKLMLLDSWERVEEMPAAESIDVGQLVHDLIAPISEARADRSLRVEAASDALAVIDPSELGHAITNLVDNALKYTTGAIDVRVRSDGACVVIDVIDEGPGIEPADARHIFDRFYRGKRRDVGGSGLGLPIAKRAIERARGTLSVSGARSGGSVFSIRLPRSNT